MKIGLKKIRHYTALSEETQAFTAELHIDGEPVAEASNRGHGEPILLVPFEGKRKIVDDAEQHVAQLPRTEILPGRDIQPTLDYVLTKLVTTDLVRRDVRRDVNRQCKPGAPETLVYWPDTNEVTFVAVQADKRYNDTDTGRRGLGADLVLETARERSADAICLNILYREQPDEAYRLYAKGIGVECEYEWTVETIVPPA